jgi:hypothetical protein
MRPALLGFGLMKNKKMRLVLEEFGNGGEETV